MILRIDNQSPTFEERMQLERKANEIRENDTNCDSVTLPDRDGACISVVDPVEVGTDSGNDSGEDRALITPLDVLGKGTPPPTSGDPSAGRNHVPPAVVGADGAKGRVILLEALEKSAPTSPAGDPSCGRNSISERGSIRVSISVLEHTAEEQEEGTSGGNGRDPDDEDDR